MAEALLFSLAERIIGRLGNSALVQEIGSIWGVEDQLLQLKDTISTIKDVLLDAEEQQSHNHQLRNWLKRLEDAVYDADDLLDHVSTKALQAKVMAGPGNKHMAKLKQVSTFFSTSNQLVFRWKMVHRINSVNKKLDVVAADRTRFNLADRPADTAIVTRIREQTHSFVLQEEVIGRDDDKAVILEQLLSAKIKDNVSVIPIVGIGGLGKTTLAQLVFNDHKVQQHFELRMWVCVSNAFDVKLIVKKIIESACNKSLANLEMDQLQKDLRQEINGKRYLLVLDDVWNENRQKWLSLKKLLNDGMEGSKIIVTTRSKKVAKITEDTMQPYDLGVLDEDKSWCLFKKLAFEQGQEPKNSSIMETGMEIVKKCGGIPLAIKTIASMLYFKNPQTEWWSFNVKELSKVSQDEEDIMPTLKLSYDHLPSHLKHCFAYCSLFPKDRVIVVQTLIDLWMAQGFIKLSDSNQSLDDVGMACFMELFWRSFFQEVEADEFGNVKKCKMHDLMHDLASLAAGTMCGIIGGEACIDKETRHVSFDLPSDFHPETLTSLLQPHKIRTVLLFHSYFDSSSRLFSPSNNEPICDAAILNFKLLRTLDMHDSGIEKVPDSIGKLIHLRYLDLSKNKHIKTLPDSITRLYNLQTLKLHMCLSLQELPRDIVKLVSLRHLQIAGCVKVTYLPCGLSQLTNLRKLSDFPLSKGKGAAPDELMSLNNLRGSLFINNLGYGKHATLEYGAANLKEKKFLQSLSLRWFSGVEAESTEPVTFETSLEVLQPHPNLKELNLYNYRGVKFSTWFPSLTNLIIFRLGRCENCQHLPPLLHFPLLKVLALENLPALEYISPNGKSDWSSSTTILQSLQKLDLVELPNLKGWWKDVADGEDTRILPSFSCLSTLIIRDCPKLTCMPPFPHLEERLELKNTSWKVFKQTVMNVAGHQSSSAVSSFSPLSKLRALHIAGIDDLQSLSDLSSFTSLKYLTVHCCPKLKHLSSEIQHLVSLKKLLISECPELERFSNDDNATVSQGVGESLHHVTTSLQTLRIWYCGNLMAIPEWIGNLEALKELEIRGCPNLKSLPEGIRGLTSLKRLVIGDCPILLQRCQNETGDDWPKISHIPSLY